MWSPLQMLWNHHSRPAEVEHLPVNAPPLRAVLRLRIQLAATIMRIVGGTTYEMRSAEPEFPAASTNSFTAVVRYGRHALT